MIDTYQIYETLSQSFGPEPAKALSTVLGRVCEELQQTATRTDVLELRAVMGELAEAQKRTEQRVGELAEAQKRTEQRVGELAEAQKRSEHRLDRLEQAVAELAEAQKRTEQRVGELVEAQKRSEHRLDRLEQAVTELAEAQKRTEEAMTTLAGRLDDTNKQLGGLSATVGYTLENEAYRHLPGLLARDYGLELTEPLDRDYVTDDRGRDWEVNILGRGRLEGREVTVIGESKVQLSSRDIDRFLERRVAVLRTVVGDVFPVLVTHMTTQKGVRDHARARGVALYLSSAFGR